MFLKILLDMIGGRNVDEMTTKEASVLVNNYYIKIFKRTLGWRNQSRVYFLAEQALKAVGLENFC